MPTVKRRKPAPRSITTGAPSPGTDAASINAFPDARRYAALRATPASLVREAARAATPFTERHLQSVWYDPQFRPAQLTTTDGEPVTVVQPGRWNLEAGPDFLDAYLVVGPARRTLRGDVEIHVHPYDWRQHGHSRDPLYRRVVAHVCYWPGRLPTGTLPPATLQIALKPTLDATPDFYFENIDVTAYPYAVPPPSFPNRPPPLAGIPPADVAHLLNAAGQERLRQKAELMAERMRREGPGQPLFEGILAALGYQHNRGACRRLARTITLARLREVAGPDAVAAHAILLGVANLLPRVASTDWDPETRATVRTLWDAWWKRQFNWESACLPRDAWRLSGIRPQNHPVRRLAAAAALFARDAELADALLAVPLRDPARWLASTQTLLNVAAGAPYWRTRFCFGGKRAAHAVALIGTPRQASILLNVILPFLAAQGRNVAPLLQVIPAEDSNQLLRQTAHMIFGPDHNPTLYDSGLHQQGLLQIFHDFCLPNRLPALTEIIRA